MNKILISLLFLYSSLFATYEFCSSSSSGTYQIAGTKYTLSSYIGNGNYNVATPYISVVPESGRYIATCFDGQMRWLYWADLYVCTTKTNEECQTVLNNVTAFFNSETCSCELPPFPDDDGDGTPNKCDFKHPDYSTLDCDGDGIPNGQDNDIDGDGWNNDVDADMNGDNKPDAADSSSPTYDSSCKGADIEGHNTVTGVVYPMSYYNPTGATLASVCAGKVDGNIIDSSFYVNDLNPNCKVTYCFIHRKKSECNYWASDFIPDGGSWIISTINNQQDCLNAKNDDYVLDAHWAAPDLTNCPMDKWCYLKAKEKVDDLPKDTNQEDNPENQGEDTNMNHPDLNSTTTDLAPLLQAQNTANKHLEDLKGKSDLVSESLADLKELSNKTLNSNIEMKSILKTLETNSNKSLENELRSLTALSSLGEGIQSTNLKLSTMGTALNDNLDRGNGFLESIDGKMTANNDLLEDIKGAVSGDGSSLDLSANDGIADLLTGDASLLDALTGEFSTFKTNILGNFSDIETQYGNAKSLFEGSLTAPNFSGSYNASCFSFTFLGKHVVLDVSFLGAISPVVYFIFVLTFMILNFRFLLNHLLKGNE